MKDKNKHSFRLTRIKIAILVFLGVLVFTITLNETSKNNPVADFKSKVVSKEEIVHGDTTKKQVIFTFDGGGETQSAEKILETLKKYHVKGTFFFTGKMVAKNPDLVKKIIADGHEIFNHTYDHPHLTELKSADIKTELNNMDQILFATTGVSSKPYFRAPYGDRDGRVLKAAHEAGYESVYWTVDALDWKEPNGETPEQVKNIIFSNLKPGTIYLMHLGDNITGEILDEVFAKIENQGYKIVSLTQGL